MSSWKSSRRTFVAGIAGTILCRSLLGDEPPMVRDARSTSGDSRVEPDWKERLTIRVGHKNADLNGTTDRVLQAAVDYVARLGGGTVHVAGGEYLLRNAVWLRSGVRILGEGDDTHLIKSPSIESKLADDSDWYDQEVTLVDPKGFNVGDGICLRTKDPHNGGVDVCKRTLVARDGARFKLDRPLRENFWLRGDTTISTLFPIITGEEISKFAIENIRLDGNGKKNANLDGNYAGCIFLQDCAEGRIQGVTAHDYNGDGISWQICHDMVVEKCRSHDHVGLGLHPGSGSQRPIMRDNELKNNDIGLFFCWGVRYGLAERNRLVDNRVGVSIGHRDVENLVVDNVIEGSRDHGLHFRDEASRSFSPHRNRFVRNKWIDNGRSADAVAIQVQGETEDVVLERNVVSDGRGPATRTAIRIGAKTKTIQLVDNEISGFKTQVDDQRKA